MSTQNQENEFFKGIIAAMDDSDDLDYLDEATGEYHCAGDSAKTTAISVIELEDSGGSNSNNHIDQNSVDAFNASDAAVYEVEYIVENDEDDENNDYADENGDNKHVIELAESDMSRHTLICRQDESGGDELYCCMECDATYESVDDFALAHKCEYNIATDGGNEDGVELVETQWEALDELPQEETTSEQGFAKVDEIQVTLAAEIGSEDEFTEQGEEAEGDGAGYGDGGGDAVVQIENEGDDDGDSEKFCCIECRMVFGDLESAEQHDCAPTNEKDGGAEDNDNDNEDDDEEMVLKANEDADLDDDGHGVKAPQLKKGGKAVREFKCVQCPRVFATVNALCSHSRTHKTKNKDDKCQGLVTCEICNTNFSSEKNLKFHMRIHDKRPSKSIQDALPAGAKVQYRELHQFFCEICNKSFDQNLILVHKNMHQNVEEFICRTCNRQFESSANYEMHMKLHEDKEQKLIKTPPVSKSKHLRNDGKLRFPCQYCGHEFARPYEKVKHERVHTGEKPYECEVCGKTFRVAYSLTLHLRTHTNIRPYVCATCNKRFKSQPVYTHHLMTHKNERTYKCDQCPKSFRTAVQLCGHKNSHKKPFSCPECNRPFSALYAVNLHMKTHQKQMAKSTKASNSKEADSVKLRCGFCGALYTRMFALRTHMKEHHNMEIEPNQRIERVQNSDDDEESFLITAGGNGEEDEAASSSPPPPPRQQSPERRVMRINRNKPGRPKKTKTNIMIAADDHEILLSNEDLMMDTFTEEIANDGDDDWLPA